MCNVEVSQVTTAHTHTQVSGYSDVEAGSSYLSAPPSVTKKKTHYAGMKTGRLTLRYPAAISLLRVAAQGKKRRDVERLTGDTQQALTCDL